MESVIVKNEPATETKPLGPPTGYVDLLDHVTTEQQQKKRTDGKSFQKTPIRPSASGECSRSLYYQLMEFHGLAKFETELNPPELERIFDLGHSIEYHAVKQFRKLEHVFELKYMQQVLSFAFLKADKPGLAQWFEGSLDLVFWSPKWKCVVDVKSKKDRFSSHFSSSWDETDEKLSKMKSVQTISDKSYWVEDVQAFLAELHDPFFEPNFKQLNMYACSDFLRERGVDHASIIQYCKNDSRMREVRFKPSLELYQKTIDKMQNVIAAVDTGNPALAPKDYVLGSLKCKFCRYAKECWPRDNPSKAFYATLPPKKWPTRTYTLGDSGARLDELFESYEAAESFESVKKQKEAAILKLMQDMGVDKVETRDERVYEARLLKDGYVIRRSKK